MLSEKTLSLKRTRDRASAARDEKTAPGPEARGRRGPVRLRMKSCTIQAARRGWCLAHNTEAVTSCWKPHPYTHMYIHAHAVRA
jgi:hypothetical protein